PGVYTRGRRLPAARGGSGGEAVALARLGGAGGAEVPVEVLLAGEHRPPRGEAAGAVAEGAQHDGAGGVPGGLQQVAARRGTGEGELVAEQDAAVELGPLHVGVGRILVLPLELDDGEAVGGHADLDRK